MAVARSAPVPHRALPLPLAACLAFALACGADTAGPLGQMAERLIPTPTPTPHPTPPPAPSPTPAITNLLAVVGDVEFEDTDPQVVVVRDGERLRLELRHRVPGSALPDSTLLLLNVPPKPGSYRLHSPAASPGSRAVQALFTTRSERVGSMKDFDHAVAGTLELREELPGVLAGAFDVAMQESPPPPPPPPKPGEPLPSMLGKVPTPPPARVQARGKLVAILSSARPAPTPPG